MESTFDFGQSWDNIASVTDRAQQFFADAGAPVDSANALAMVATELSENALKYGEKSNEKVHVRLQAEGSEFQVEVTNRVNDETADNLRRLDEMVQWIRGFQDPFQAYVERLREVSAQRLEDARSGLGLVRVAYEGRAVLDFIVDHNNKLTVSAVRRD